jgi:hypothetical protein
MLSYEAFFAKWNNKYCEVSDPSNPNQCYDLAVAWTDNLGIPRTAIQHLYAYQIYTQPIESTYLNLYRIPNTPSAMPLKGDIIVWDYTYNGYAGHVGISSGIRTLNSLQVFEQNDPLKSVCHLKTYNYNSILGWLRPMCLYKAI